MADIIDSIKEGKCKISIDECKPHQSFCEIVFPTVWEIGEDSDWRKVLGDKTLFHRCEHCSSKMFEVHSERRRVVRGKNEQVYIKVERRHQFGWYCKTCGYLQEKTWSPF